MNFRERNKPDRNRYRINWQGIQRGQNVEAQDKINTIRENLKQYERKILGSISNIQESSSSANKTKASNERVIRLQIVKNKDEAIIMNIDQEELNLNEEEDHFIM